MDRLLLASLALCLVTRFSIAGNITYRLTEQSIDDVEVTGTITTDGTLGLVDETNLVSWQLTSVTPARSHALTDFRAFSGITASGSTLVYGGIPLSEEDWVGFNDPDDPSHTGWGLSEAYGMRVSNGPAYTTPVSFPITFAVVVPESSTATNGWVASAFCGLVAIRRQCQRSSRQKT